MLLNKFSLYFRQVNNSEINTLTGVHFGAFATIPLANKFALLTQPMKPWTQCKKQYKHSITMP